MLCLEPTSRKGPVHQVIHILIHMAAILRRTVWKAGSGWEFGTRSNQPMVTPDR
jgi:hypothetical protein